MVVRPTIRKLDPSALETDLLHAVGQSAEAMSHHASWTEEDARPSWAAQFLAWDSGTD